MTASPFTDRLGDPFADEGKEGGYKPWLSSSGGVRDLKLIPAKGDSTPVRFEPYMQAISIELNPDETALCLMCHTTGHLIFIEGRGLGELADHISAKRVKSVHVWHPEHDEDAPPRNAITAIRFEKGQGEG